MARWALDATTQCAELLHHAVILVFEAVTMVDVVTAVLLAADEHALNLAWRDQDRVLPAHILWRQCHVGVAVNLARCACALHFHQPTFEHTKQRAMRVHRMELVSVIAVFPDLEVAERDILALIVPSAVAGRRLSPAG